MSKLIVQVSKIDNVVVHPNAEKLALAIIGGWQIVIKKGEYKPGDIAIYIPPASCVPVELSDRYGFSKYLHGGRVKAARLRGEPSHGVLIPNEGKWQIGTDVAEHYGIKEYLPPPPKNQGACSDQESPHPLFTKYTEIENMRHFSTVFEPGEEVVVTEKIHGTNNRVAMIEGEIMAGSHNHRRRMPMMAISLPWYRRLVNFILCYPPPMIEDVARMQKDWYWSPAKIPQVATLLNDMGMRHQQVIMFGEVFGGAIQKGVRYGTPTQIAHRAFDLLLDGRYMDYDDFEAVCSRYGVATAPLLYRGPFSLEKIKELSDGKTTIGNDTHIKEGVVVRPVNERTHPKIGRVILKWVSDHYLESKDIGDFEDE